MKRRSDGFTLIEVLVVVAVTGLILALLGQGLRLGLSGTQSYFRVVRTQSDVQPVEHALRSMIERMDPGLYPEPPQMRGAAQSLTFTTELPDPETGRAMTADVLLGVEHGHLVLVWTPHGGGIPFGQPPPSRHEVLLDHVDRLDISYAARGSAAAWVSSWNQPALPGLVRMRIETAKGRETWPPIIISIPREQAEE
jgi:prepilin-type N-terminal cleavage/methylation domain-containing protein